MLSFGDSVDLERLHTKIGGVVIQPLTRARARRSRDACLDLVRRLQLFRRGWADQDCWSLDVLLCSRLAAQLQHLADTDHGWPDDAYAEPADWQQALRYHAGSLLRYDPFADGDTVITGSTLRGWQRREQHLHFTYLTAAGSPSQSRPSLPIGAA